jgi:hypothetical protein
MQGAVAACVVWRMGCGAWCGGVCGSLRYIQRARSRKIIMLRDTASTLTVSTVDIGHIYIFGMTGVTCVHSACSERSPFMYR